LIELANEQCVVFFGNDVSIETLHNNATVLGCVNYTIAAMEAGKEPIDAVKIASKFDPSTGLGFKKLEFK
jgi:hypothetical protein